MNIEYSYKNIGTLHAAFVAAGLPIDGVNYVEGAANVTAMFTSDLSAGQQATAAAVHSGVDTWSLSANGTNGSVDIVVSGANSACTWLIMLDGEEIATETDNSAPYGMTLTAPVTAGLYTVIAVAQDGTATGKLEIEVI